MDKMFPKQDGARNDVALIANTCVALDNMLPTHDGVRSDVALVGHVAPCERRGIVTTSPLVRLLATNACESQIIMASRLLRINPGERPSAEECVAMFDVWVCKPVGDCHAERSDVARPVASEQVCKTDIDCACTFPIAVSHARAPRRRIP